MFSKGVSILLIVLGIFQISGTIWWAFYRFGGFPGWWDHLLWTYPGDGWGWACVSALIIGCLTAFSFLVGVLGFCIKEDKHGYGRHTAC